MEYAWFVVVAIFALACLTTYGFYLNVLEDARERAGIGAEHGTLSAKLDAELLAAANGASDVGARRAVIVAKARKVA